MVTFHPGPGGGRAARNVAPLVRAALGRRVLAAVGHRQQGCSVAGQRLPALLLEVQHQIHHVFLQVGEPAAEEEQEEEKKEGGKHLVGTPPKGYVMIGE